MSGRRGQPDRVEAGCGWWAGLLALLVAVIGVVGAVLAAGPDNVMEHTKAAFGSYRPPEILKVTRQGKRPDSNYVVTLTNPSFEEVALLSYHVEPVASFAAATAATNDGGSDVSRARIDVFRHLFRARFAKRREF